MSRSSIVGAAAWSLPVVSLAARAPDASASLARARLVKETFAVFKANYVSSKPTKVRAFVQLRNAPTPSTPAPQPTINPLTAVVTYGGNLVAASDPTNIAGAGWSFAGRSTNADGSVAFTFTYTRPLAPYASTSQLEFSAALLPNPSGPSAGVLTASAAGVTPLGPTPSS